DVVALLPAAYPTPCDFRGHVEQIEGIRGDAAPSNLMRRDAEIAELEPVPPAHEHVERRQVAMQRLATVQPVQRAEHARDLATDEALGLRSVFAEPCADIAVFGVLHRQAVAHLPAI